MTNLEGEFFDAINGIDQGTNAVFFNINNNDSLEHIIGSPNLLYYSLEAVRDSSLKTISGFTNARRIEGLSVGSCPELVEMKDYDQVEYIGSENSLYLITSLSIGSVPLDSTLSFPKLKKIYGGLGLTNISRMTQLPKLDSLKVINESVIMYRNESLQKIDDFHQLDTIGGKVLMYEFPLLDTVVFAKNLRHIGGYPNDPSGIFLRDMPQLVHFGGLDSIKFIEDHLGTKNSPLLTTAPALCNILSSPGGLPPDVTLQDNAEPFNSIEGIEIHCDELLPVETAETLEKVKLYPNPVYDWLRIENGEDVRQLKIVNMAGQVVYEARKWNGNGVDLSRLPTGVYLVQLYDGEGNHVSHRMIKVGRV